MGKNYFQWFKHDFRLLNHFSRVFDMILRDFDGDDYSPIWNPQSTDHDEGFRLRFPKCVPGWCSKTLHNPQVTCIVIFSLANLWDNYYFQKNMGMFPWFHWLMGIRLHFFKYVFLITYTASNTNGGIPVPGLTSWISLGIWFRFDRFNHPNGSWILSSV